MLSSCIKMVSKYSTIFPMLLTLCSSKRFPRRWYAILQPRQGCGTVSLPWKVISAREGFPYQGRISLQGKDFPLMFTCWRKAPLQGIFQCLKMTILKKICKSQKKENLSWRAKYGKLSGWNIHFFKKVFPPAFSCVLNFEYAIFHLLCSFSL